MTTPELWIMPVPFIDASGGQAIVTSWYGDGRGHVAIDVGATDGIDWGTPVLAPIGGKVVATGYDGPFRPPNGHTAGRWLWFIGDDGSFHKFFHTAEGAIVPLNVHVDQGTPIARVGNSGTGASHLHWEVHRPGSWSSPTNFDAVVRDLIARGRWAGHVPDTTAPPEPPDVQEDEMTPDQEARILERIDAAGTVTRSFLSERLEQVAAADRATMGALSAAVVEAVVRADENDEAIVTRKRDELLAVIKPQLDRIEADAADKLAEARAGNGETTQDQAGEAA